MVEDNYSTLFFSIFKLPNRLIHCNKSKYADQRTVKRRIMFLAFFPFIRLLDFFQNLSKRLNGFIYPNFSLVIYDQSEIIRNDPRLLRRYIGSDFNKSPLIIIPYKQNINEKKKKKCKTIKY